MRRLVLLLLALCLAAPVAAQVSAFRYDPARVPVGTVFHYRKSNRDGSHATRIALYVAAADRIEAFKYDSGGAQATLVVGLLDWEAFALRRLESYAVARGQPDQLKAWLDSDRSAGGVRVFYAPDTLIRVARWPWHSYDFDWASLNLALPHLVRPEGRVELERADVVYGEESAAFMDVGPLTLTYEARDERQGVPVRRYRLAGPGLTTDVAGTIFTDLARGHIVEFRMPVGDEPGYRDGWLRLEGSARMTAEAWRAFRGRMVGE